MNEPSIFDATPLIYLGKARILDKIQLLSRRNIIPTRIFEGVVSKGKQRGDADAFYVEELVRCGLLEVQEVPEQRQVLKENQNLSPADIDVLSLAHQLRGRAITDDQAVRLAAAIENIPVGGTLSIVLGLVKRGEITRQECRQLIETMIEQGWYCSVSMYARILQKLDFI